MLVVVILGHVSMEGVYIFFSFLGPPGERLSVLIYGEEVGTYSKMICLEG